MKNNSDILNNSETKKENKAFNNKIIKLLNLRKNKYLQKSHLQFINLSNMIKNRRMKNENDLFKTKLKITNNFTNDDTSYSLIKSYFSSGKKIIKKALEFRNLSNNSISKENNQRTFLTQNTNQNNNYNFPSINFNSCLNDYLRNSNLKIFYGDNITNFKENSRVKRLCNYLNHFCKNLLKEYKKNDYFDKLEKNISKADVIYENYKENIKSYLSFLKIIQQKEENVIDFFKKRKMKILENVKELNVQIKKYKDIKNQGMDIKKFLMKVKGDDHKNIINNFTRNRIGSFDVSKKLDIKNKNPEINDKKKDINENLNINGYKIYLSPIKNNKLFNSVIQINENSKTAKKTQKILNYKKKDNLNIRSKYYNTRLKSKSKRIANYRPIFSNTDEFVDMYDEKLKNIRNYINEYNKTINKINILKNNNVYINKLEKNNEEEKYCSNILKSLKNENKTLNNKLCECRKMKISEGFNMITIKVKEIILNIYSINYLRIKFGLTNFLSNLKEFDLNEDKKEKNKNLYLLKILEMIIDTLLEDDQTYRKDSKYKKVKSEIENIKFEMIRKKQLDKIKKINAEKTRKISEHHRKTRFFHLNKNGINLQYHNNITQNYISSLSEDNIIDKKIKNKKEEIKGLIYYN